MKMQKFPCSFEIPCSSNFSKIVQNTKIKENYLSVVFYNDVQIFCRASALEVTDKYVDIFPKLENSVENVKKTARPRYIKSHLPWELLPHQIFKIKPKVSSIYFCIKTVRKVAHYCTALSVNPKKTVRFFAGFY